MSRAWKPMTTPMWLYITIARVTSLQQTPNNLELFKKLKDTTQRFYMLSSTLLIPLVLLVPKIDMMLLPSERTSSSQLTEVH